MTGNKEKNNSILYQNRTTEPCHLSSSIYYGGQDIYYPPTASHNTVSIFLAVINIYINKKNVKSLLIIINCYQIQYRIRL